MRLGSELEASSSPVDDPPDRGLTRLWADCRPAVRWVVLPVLAALAVAVVALSVVSWRKAASQPARYETHVDVALTPVAPSSRYDDEAASLSPDEAMDLALGLARGADVQDAIDDELPFRHTIDYLPAGDDTLRIRTRAASAPLAVRAASSSATIFGQYRDAEATAQVNEAIAALRAQIDDATGAEAEAAQLHLDQAIAARDAGSTAYVVAPPETPCCVAENDETRAPRRGVIALIGLVLLAIGVILFERWHRRRKPGPTWAGRAVAFLGDQATAFRERFSPRRLRSIKPNATPRHLWADCRPAVRWVLLPALAAAAIAVILVTISSWRDAVAEPDRYEAFVDVALAPVVPSSRYDDEVAALSPDEAMDLTVAFARRADVRDAIDDELPFDYTIDYLRVGDDALRIRTGAATPRLAVRASSSAAAIFGQIRDAEAVAEASDAITSLRARIDDDAGADLERAQQQLDRAIAARDAGATAYVIAPPETPCCTADNDEMRSPRRGASVVIGLALVALGIILFERRRRNRTPRPPRPHWTKRLAALLGARGRDLRSRLTAVPGDLSAGGERVARRAQRTVHRDRGPLPTRLPAWRKQVGTRFRKTSTAVGTGTVRMAGSVRRLWTDCRPGVRRLVLPALAAVSVAVLVVTAVSWRNAVAAPDRYETHTDIALIPVVPSARYDDETAALSPDEAMEITLEFARRADVQAAIDEGIPFDHTVDYLRADDDTLRIRTRATTPEQAVEAASAASAGFGRIRNEEATRELNRVINDLQAQLADGGDDVPAVQRRLDRALDARHGGTTAYVAAPPATPCCKVHQHALRAPRRGAAVLVGLGLLALGVMLYERWRRHAKPRPR